MKDACRHPIYLATALLERNRWAPPPRSPTIRVSEWLPRIAGAGFQGVELWENHWRLASEEERAALRASPVPIRIFNSYIPLDAAPPEELAGLTGAVSALSGTLDGIKFNLPRGQGAPAGSALRALSQAQALPRSVRLFCECHPGTVADSPATAAQAFALWPGDRFAAIVHPLFDDAATYAAWLRALEGRIAHAHLQLPGKNCRRLALADHRQFAADRLGALLQSGYRGTFTLEFTAGVERPDTPLESLWVNACNDLAVLRGILPATTPA